MKQKRNRVIILRPVLILLTLFVYGCVVGCPIRTLTGVPCPGCGMTRAWISLLSFNLSKAFYYHPLWIMPPVVIIAHTFFRPRNTKVYNILLMLFFALFIVVYIVRFVSGSEVVSPSVDAGILNEYFPELMDR